MNQTRIQSYDTQRTILTNGVSVISQTIPGMHTVTVGIWVKNGARSESPNEYGIAHFIEHLLFKGTTKRTARTITREIDSLGAVINAFTSYEYVCYYAKCLQHALHPVMDVLCDLFLHSTFPLDEIERERGVVLQEIHMRDDSPEEALHDQLHVAFWGEEHQLGHHILGPEQNIRTLDREAILAYRSRLYQPEDIMVVAAGAVDHQTLTTIVDQAFSQGNFECVRSRSEMHDWTLPASPMIIHHGRDIGQTLVGIATKGCPASAAERFDMLVLNALLGGGMSSRLFEEIREKRGLAYSVYSYASSFADAGMFGVYAGTAPDTLGKTVAIMRDEMKRITIDAVPLDELHSTKEQVKGRILMSLESSDSYMTRLARSYRYFDKAMPLAQVLDGIDQVTPDSLQRLAQLCFNPHGYTIMTMGPVDAETRRVIEADYGL